MRIVLIGIAVILMLGGGVWLLQGIGILPGSFMTGQTRWAVYGALAFLAGTGLLIAALRRKSSQHKAN
jgi:hypothetical protein